ncbi:hypothetical protein ACA910_020279 [Epithemia clementina (nom. ined.)]
MGDIWLTDRAISTDEVLEALRILDEEFTTLQTGQRRLEVCLAAALIVAGFMAALRGEEIPQIDLGMMQKYWREAKDYHCKPHILLALVGRFKETSGAIKVFIKPLTPVTSSGIRVEEWLGRTIDEYDRLGVTSGPMFRVSLTGGQVKRAMVGTLDALFHEVMKRVQFLSLDLIGPEVKVDDMMSARRSLRRGATTDAQNRKIPVSVI